MGPLWKVDPTVEFFKGDHIVIAVFSICIFNLFLVPYTFLLLFGYHLQACSGRREFCWFNKYKPLLDTHYAPHLQNSLLAWIVTASSSVYSH